MSILTDDDLLELQEEWNPKHYANQVHEFYIPDPVVRGAVTSHAEKIYHMSIKQFRKYMENTEL